MLHVVDRTSGGVPIAVRAYVQNSPAAFRHHIISPFGTNDEPAPVWDGIDVTHHDLGNGTLRRIRTLRATVEATNPEVVHAHSSFAGAYARARRLRNGTRIVYTPHCFSFSRADIGAVSRIAYRGLEWILGWRTDLVAACSPGEATLANGLASIKNRSIYVPNVPSITTGPRARETPTPGRIRVGTLGRVSTQKDPKTFLSAATLLSSAGTQVEASWIGDGDTNYKNILRSAGVQVTGWVSGEELINELSQLDVYLHTAAWEGFPIAVLDAYAVGLPILVRPIEAFGDIDPILTIGAGMHRLVQAMATIDGYAKWRNENRSAWGRYLRRNSPSAQSVALGVAWSRTTTPAKQNTVDLSS